MQAAVVTASAAGAMMWREANFGDSGTIDALSRKKQYFWYLYPDGKSATHWWLPTPIAYVT